MFLLLKREYMKRDINFARVYILIPKYFERVVYSFIVIIFKKKMDPTKPILGTFPSTKTSTTIPDTNLLPDNPNPPARNQLHHTNTTGSSNSSNKDNFRTLSSR